VKLYIGAIFGGPEVPDSACYAALGRLGRRSDAALRRARRSAGKAAPSDRQGGLDIVFHVPGSIIKPEFSGERTGKFSRRERLLMVQIAVPAELVWSPKVEHFMLEALRRSIRLAKPVYDKAGIPFSVERYTELVDRMQSAGAQ